MSQTLRILHLEDNPDDRLLALRELSHKLSNIQVNEVIDATGLEQALAAGQFDIVITDYQLFWTNGLEVLRAVKSRYPDCPVIMFTNTGSEEVAVEGMKNGLDDYVMKSPKYYKRLVPAVRSALERVAAERRANRLELRFRELLNRLNVGVFRLTLDGQLLEANAGFLHLLGFNSLSEAQSADLGELYLPIENPPESLKRNREVQLRRSHGDMIWVLLNEVFSTNEGETVIDGLMENITEGKQAEVERNQLLAREKAARADAEAANRLKDEFLATLSHELRTPINVLLGWSQLLRGGNLSPAIFTRALDVIGRNAKILSQLIEDLLDVSRIITGKFRLECRPIQLTPIIEEAIYIVRPAAEAKDIQIEFTPDFSADRISGDANRLQQVVWNLLSNAVKFTPQGGKVQISLKSSSSQVQLQVSDTGQGINPEFLPYVFDRFRQADSSTTRSHGGLGLGLAIVRQLVELHGGTVEAESKGEGQGATFTVTLPTVDSHQGPKDDNSLPGQISNSEPGSVGRQLLEGLRILVVDDEADMRDLLITVIKEYGATVEAAASAEEAINLLKRTQPDVLISDIGMPGEDGYTLIRRVRVLKAQEGGQTPALALTAYARDEDRNRVLAAGYQLHIAKPVSPAELATAVANLAGRSSSI